LSKITLGYPEVLHISGTALLIADQFTAGLIFCILGFLGTVSRLGVELSAKEKQEKEAARLREDMGNAGAVLSKMLENFLVKNAKNNTRVGGDYH